MNLLQKILSIDKKRKEQINEEKQKFTEKEKFVLMLEELGSEECWNDVILQLTKDKQLSNSPKDISLIMQTIIDTVMSKNEVDIKDALFKIYKKEIEKVLVSGFPDWYKQYLLTVYSIK